MTARDLITGALRLIGVVESGGTLDASEATDGLSALNDLIDSLSNEKLLIPNKVREVFPLVTGKQTYTMGTGGDFNTSRPMQIENALIQLTSSTPALEIPMHLLTKDQYAGVLLKTLESTFPLYAYVEDTYPLMNVNVWPVPTDANNLVLYSAKPLATLSTLDTAISLPPGYQRMLRYNLAVELSPEYGKAVPDVVAMIAAESKADLKRTNFKPRYLRVDDTLMAKPAVWNWMTGEPT